MSKKIKKSVAMLMCMALMIGLLPICNQTVKAVIYTSSGKCGDDVYWELDMLDTETSVLKIYGKGKMDDYSPSSVYNPIAAPWYGKYITRVEISSGVTNIGHAAFENCRYLTSITIPKSVTSIGESAFWGCGSLTGITIPDSVTSIGSWAFSDCTNLANITIPKSVTSISNGAFSGCNSLKSVMIPNGIDIISANAFENCTSLTNITIPNSVVRINESAFSNCRNITSIIIPDSVISINSKAFNNCNSLKSITIPDSVILIGESAFAGCNKLLHAYYLGTKSDWEFISIGSNNLCLTSALTFHYQHKFIDTVIEPTYAEQGYTIHKCSVCGYSYKDSYTAKKKNEDTTSTQSTVTTKPAKVKFSLKSVKKKVTIKWNKVKGVSGYTVYYKTKKKGKWKKLKNVSTKKTKYVKKKLKSGKTYYFTVKAYKSANGKKVYGKFVTKKIKVK